MSICIESNNLISSMKIKKIILDKINNAYLDNRPVVIVCIGTDRSTGDSLGPLIGDKLNNLLNDKINLYGTLEYPVHAKNLHETIDTINSIYKNPYVIAIDASLGKFKSIGKIFIEDKPLVPGSAFDKGLPPIGDLSISGVVNVSGISDFMILQGTRLHSVMKMANIISRGIFFAIIEYNKNIQKNYYYNTCEN